MSAVRVARFNTQRKLIVLFSNTYHGWWDGVVTRLRDDSPGGVLLLKNRDPASLKVVKARASEIAAVLVDPYTAFNSGPGLTDSALFDASMREGGLSDQTKEQASAAADTAVRASGGGIQVQVEAHRMWLLQLRALTASASIPLIFDEVYSGFRMAHCGGQEFFGVKADLVAYGKTLGGGMPIGVVCGKQQFMRRFDELRPFRVSPIIGTFAAAPLTLGATAEFLAWHREPSTKDLYVQASLATAAWVEDTNAKICALVKDPGAELEAIPVRLVSLSTVWTVLFDAPGRYHWLFSYYLRVEGLSVSWIGTGRCSFSVDFAESPETGRKVQAALLRAAARMRKDGWWWAGDAKSH
jgi:glutamate-1-semialdehyde 2,1-aminomutase